MLYVFAFLGIWGLSILQNYVQHEAKHAYIHILFALLFCCMLSYSVFRFFVSINVKVC